MVLPPQPVPQPEPVPNPLPEPDPLPPPNPEPDPFSPPPGRNSAFINMTGGLVQQW